MRTIFTLTFFLIAFCTYQSFGQNLDGPNEWTTKEEYKSAESQVIENIKWLETNPLHDDEELRKEVGAYVMKWLLGCPYLTIEMSLKYEGDIMMDKKYEYAGKVATLFLFGKALYMLEHPDEKKKELERNSDERGIISMVTAYKILVEQKGKDAKHKTMDKYVKMEKEGKLAEFVKSGKKP